MADRRRLTTVGDTEGAPVPRLPLANGRTALTSPQGALTPSLLSVQPGPVVRELAEEDFASIEAVDDMMLTPDGFVIGHAKSMLAEQISALEQRLVDLAGERDRRKNRWNTAKKRHAELVSRHEFLTGQHASALATAARIKNELELEHRRAAIEETISRLAAGPVHRLPRGLRWVYRAMGSTTAWAARQAGILASQTSDPSGVLRRCRASSGWQFSPSITISGGVVVDRSTIRKLEDVIRRSESETRSATQELHRLSQSIHDSQTAVTRSQDSLREAEAEFERTKLEHTRSRAMLNRSEIRYTGEGHLITFAPTRAGKGVNVVVPNLISYPGPVVVVDVKGSNFAITARARHRMGHRVALLDPFGVLRGMGIDAARAGINPLDLIDREDPLCVDAARSLAAAIVPSHSDPEKNYFSHGAQELLAGVILHVIFGMQPQARTFVTVHRLINYGKKRWEKLLHDMSGSRHANGAIANAANGFLKQSDRAAGNVQTTLLHAIQFIGSKPVSQTLSRTTLDLAAPKGAATFDLKELKTRGDLSVYLVLSEEHIATYAPLMRLWINCLITSLQRIHGRPEKRILFLLDEVAQLGRMPSLFRSSAIMSERGLTMWFILQDLAQLKAAYPAEWPSFLSNAAVKQFFRIEDQETAEMVSRMLGDTLAYTTSGSQTSSRGQTAARGQSHATSESHATGSSMTYTHGNSYSHTTGSSGQNAISTQSTGTTSGEAFGRSEQNVNGTSVGQTTNEGWQVGQGTGLTFTPTSLPLKSPAELRQLDPRQLVLFCEHRPAILADNVPYYENPALRGRFDENPLRKPICHEPESNALKVTPSKKNVACEFPENLRVLRMTTHKAL